MTEKSFPSPKVLPAHLHVGGAPDDEPFGEKIIDPELRVIPAAFRGSWTPNASSKPQTDVIEDDQVTIDGKVEPVVAVRVAGADGIAVVTQQVEDGRWEYALRYFGLADNGNRLIDLESMDWTWRRTS